MQSSLILLELALEFRLWAKVEAIVRFAVSKVCRVRGGVFTQVSGRGARRAGVTRVGRGARGGIDQVRDGPAVRLGSAVDAHGVLVVRVTRPAQVRWGAGGAERYPVVGFPAIKVEEGRAGRWVGRRRVVMDPGENIGHSLGRHGERAAGLARVSL